ncbi:MAG TPA: aminoglycoside phosphotransferase [Desulfobacteraceae bacterium]|nr:aminoglycoside phosphotransferase [Desulfobacteraceae bacterium]
MCTEEKKNQIVELAGRRPQQADTAAASAIADVSPLTGDGSQRQFFRVRLTNGRFFIAVFPAGGKAPEKGEARSAWLIGRHLFEKGVPVPRPLARDKDSGLILFEDLGDIRLYDLVHGHERIGVKTEEYYRQAVRALVHMQIEGGRGFDVAWCWQTPSYDRRLMLERESGYFLQSLCRDYLHLDIPNTALECEFSDIADHAGRAPAHFFLHRDFQSRNLMLKEGKVRIIDFQGGRLGPLGYDLASLLFDPYACLPGAVREALFEEYLKVLRQYIAYDPERFRDEFHYLALQRHLQALGAFAFLGARRGKSFFLPFIRPALHSLHILLAGQITRKYPCLLHLAERCLDSLSPHGL